MSPTQNLKNDSCLVLPFPRKTDPLLFLQTMAPQPPNVLSPLPSETLVPLGNFRLFQSLCLGETEDRNGGLVKVIMSLPTRDLWGPLNKISYSWQYDTIKIMIIMVTDTEHNLSLSISIRHNNRNVEFHLILTTSHEVDATS